MRPLQNRGYFSHRGKVGPARQGKSKIEIKAANSSGSRSIRGPTGAHVPCHSHGQAEFYLRLLTEQNTPSLSSRSAMVTAKYRMSSMA